MERDEQKLLAGLEQSLSDTYHAARRLKPPYNPTEFRRMLLEHGAKETADRLLAAGNPSSGFTELFLRGKDNLRLSLEYVVLNGPWRALFTPQQLAIARRRLQEVDVEPPA
jgi:hypothetical protein